MKLIDVKDHPNWQYSKDYPNTRIQKTATISGNARVYGCARVYGDAEVSENARVSGYARVYAKAQVSENANVFGNAQVSGCAKISENAWVYDYAHVNYYAKIYGNAIIRGKAIIRGNARVSGDTKVDEIAQIGGDGEILKTEDHMVIESPNKMPITLHRDKEIGIRINWYDFTGTIEEYIFEHRKFKNQYFHQGMIPKYYNILKNRMTPLESDVEVL